MTDSTKNVDAKLERFLEEHRESLKPLAPEDGVDRFLRNERPEVADSTLRQHRRKLAFFREYCDLNDIEDLNKLDGRAIDEYQIWRREESSDIVEQLSRTTMRDDMHLLQKTLRYFESIKAVSEGLADDVQIPSVPDGEDVRDVELDPERVQQILDYLEKYKYATLEHVVWLLHCRTGRRPGCLYSLDCADVYLDVDDPYIEFTHRDGETRLKNASKSETQVSISTSFAKALRDYLENCRVEVVDEYGRSPLLTSSDGRLAKSTMRRYFYKWTRPCQVTGDCPHDRTLDECEAVDSLNEASKCPSARSPYSTRHGYFTEMRRKGVPIAVLSERCDVSEDILEKHYDERTDEERRELRRQVMDEVAENDEGGGYL